MPLRQESGRSNRHRSRKPSYFEECSESSGESSTISSFSASTASTWSSLPRNRQARRSASEGPRRHGSSFRVSLRPSRSRYASNSVTSLDDYSGVDSAISKTLRRVLCVLMMMALAVTALHLFVQPSSQNIGHLYEIFDKLSTEELVARDEMSSRGNEEHLETKVDEHFSKSLPILDNAMAQPQQQVSGLRGTATDMALPTGISTVSANVGVAPRTINPNLHFNQQIGSGNLDQQAVNTSFNRQSLNGEFSPQFVSVHSNQQTLDGNFDQEAVNGSPNRQIDVGAMRTAVLDPTVSSTVVDKSLDENGMGNLYESVFKNREAYDPEAALTGHTALRMIVGEDKLPEKGDVSVEEEDKLPPKNDLNMDLGAYNVTKPEREDWSPSFQQKNFSDHPVVAYILPVFTCYKLSGVNAYGFNEPSNDREFHDAALMLHASVHQNSVRNPNSNSSYDYEMVALVHRGIQSCASGSNRTQMLIDLGYRVEVVREPIHQINIENEYLRNHAPRNNGGRAGMREMIRLYAFKMVEYPITVLVDTTTWLLHPPDAIFDTLLNGPHGHEWAESHPDHIVRDTFYPNGTIATTEKLPTELDIMFTRDYSTMQQGDWTTGISLAFVPIRPSLQTFRKLISIYQTTTYGATYGWDNKGYTKYAGSMQTKGLLTYFFSEIRPQRKLELHRCIYNNLADVPYIAGKRGGSDNCRDVKEHKRLPDGSPMPCTDCRIQEWGKIVVANYAICQSPWVCPWIENSGNIPLLVPTLNMCRRFHEHWFTTRLAVENIVVNEVQRTRNRGTFQREVFKGYCMPGGERGGAYLPMEMSTSLPNGFGNTMLPTVRLQQQE